MKYLSKILHVSIFASIFILALHGIKSVQAQDPADYIFKNGNILTVDENFSIAEAFAFKGDRFTGVGTNADIDLLSGPSTQIIDLQGRTVIPGIIDNHVHFLRSSPYWKWEVFFDGVQTRAEAVELLKAKIASVGPGVWVMSIGGWNIRQFTDSKTEFSKSELDGYAPNNPVFIQYGFSGGYANSLALDAVANVVQTDPNETVNTSTGYISSGGSDEGLPELVRLALPEYTKESWKTEYLAKMNEDYNRAGITTVMNMGALRFNNDFSDWAEEYVKDNGGWSNVRLFHHIISSANDPTSAEMMKDKILNWGPLEKGDYFRYQTFAERLYGPTYDMGGWNPTIEDLQVYKSLMEAPAEVRWPIAEHMLNAGKYADVMDIWEEIDAQYDIKPLRWSIHHCDYMTTGDVNQANALNLFLAMHVGHIAYNNQTNQDRPPFKTAQESGIMWGLGTDAKIVSPYMAFIIMYVAVTGKNIGGGMLNPNQKVSREEALIAYTRSNAWFLWMEDDLGSIEPDKYADFAVLDKEYIGDNQCTDEEIRNIESVLTVVGGRIGYTDGTIDMQTSINSKMGSSQRHNTLSIYQNRSNSSAKILYNIEQSSNVSIKVYNLRGREVASLVNKYHSKGEYNVTFDGSSLANDIYFVKMTAGNLSQSHKVIIVK